MNKQKQSFKNEKQYRLPGWNYSKAGYYFITICTQNRQCLLVGTDPGVRSWDSKENINCFELNTIGKMVRNWWVKIPKKFPNIILNQYVIMPDHLHGILIIKNGERELIIDNKTERTHGSVPTENADTNGSVFTEKNKPVGLVGEAIRWFKTMSTNEYIRNIKTNNWPRFEKRIWQTRFYDRILRNEKEYWAIKKYIIDNPINWNRDRANKIYS